MVYRVWPREFNYQFYSVKMPRGSSCFLCWSATLQGIEGLPQGMHYVAAPYAAGFSEAFTRRPRPAAPRSPDTVAKGELGLDIKWLPDAGTVVDATINPDFSQVESDVVQIGVNERFALFYPEKRPFFLEQVDLLQTPIQAIYTRTITDPLWGGRLTSPRGLDLVHGSCDRRPRRRHGRHPGADLLGHGAAGLHVVWSASGGCATTSALVRRRRRDRARRRGRRVQLRRRPRLPVAPQRRRPRHRPVPLQFFAFAGPSGPLAVVARPEDLGFRPDGQLERTRPTTGTGCSVRRFRGWLPRRRWIRAAGRIQPGHVGSRVSDLSDGVLLASGAF